MVCKKCGTILKVGNSICGYCGFDNSLDEQSNISDLSSSNLTLEKKESSNLVNIGETVYYNDHKIVKIIIFILMFILIGLISFKILKKVKYNQSYYYNIYDGCTDLNGNVKQIIKKSNVYYVLNDDNNLFYYNVVNDNKKYKVNECKQISGISGVKKIYTDDDYIYLLFNDNSYKVYKSLEALEENLSEDISAVDIKFLEISNQEIMNNYKVRDYSILEDANYILSNDNKLYFSYEDNSYFSSGNKVYQVNLENPLSDDSKIILYSNDDINQTIIKTNDKIEYIRHSYGDDFEVRTFENIFDIRNENISYIFYDDVFYIFDISGKVYINDKIYVDENSNNTVSKVKDLYESVDKTTLIIVLVVYVVITIIEAIVSYDRLYTGFFESLKSYVLAYILAILALSVVIAIITKSWFYLLTILGIVGMVLRGIEFFILYYICKKICLKISEFNGFVYIICFCILKTVLTVLLLFIL